MMVSSDRDSFREAVRICNALWGGLYNPIVPVDQPEAANLVEIFSPDFLVPVGDSPELGAFMAKFPYLLKPYYNGDLFMSSGADGEGRAQVLDIQNLYHRWRHSPKWKSILDRGFRLPKWQANDPLADVFLAQFGEFPDPKNTGIDYKSFFLKVTSPTEVEIPIDSEVPEDLLDYPRVTHFGRFGLTPHYRARAKGICEGIYAGDVENGADLINFWNLRACGISLLFHDFNHPDRTSKLNSRLFSSIREHLKIQDTSFRSRPTIWTRDGALKKAAESVGDKDVLLRGLSIESWNGLNIRPMQMHFGQEASLGVFGGNPERPRLRFAMKDKPFAGDTRFHTQHLVASISLIGGKTDGTNYTFIPPCVPELNEFASRTMHHDHRKIRLEAGSVGVVIDAADHDIHLRAINVQNLIERIFDLGGYTAKVSASGLITRQLILGMGGVDGARAFKIPGVRQLLKTYGPTATFGKKGALQIIASTNKITGSKFSDHCDLFIEQRDWAKKLTPAMVFGHLVEKGIFRIGVDLICPACSLKSWIALDELKQQAVCNLCGSDFDATRQLVENDFAYRRSGLLGIEKNVQGAIPVSLLLQQLSVNLFGSTFETQFGVSHDLTPKDPDAGLPVCETDFCVVVESVNSSKTPILIGECKDASGSIDANDIENLRQVANALPAERFDVFILLAKLSAFEKTEIQLAKTLNEQPWMRRVILLSHRELEPYHLYERTNDELGSNFHGGTAEDMAIATHEIYFNDVPAK
ncbi:hypothetical protein [Leisingera sp. ANG-S5]|uniref:hypothetical protein n=1 Tax=Leisingera sp. ANG-S5 TaxID=1577901 RepID=UPI0019D34C93|nr:hypothetical protein [Leisingera sp. ANG-S5]